MTNTNFIPLNGSEITFRTKIPPNLEAVNRKTFSQFSDVEAVKNIKPAWETGENHLQNIYAHKDHKKVLQAALEVASDEVGFKPAITPKADMKSKMKANMKK